MFPAPCSSVLARPAARISGLKTYDCLSLSFPEIALGSSTFKRERQGLEGDGHQSESGSQSFVIDMFPKLTSEMQQAKATRTSAAEQHSFRKV